MDEIPFVGEGIKKKVKELIEQGKMTKLESLTSDKKLMILEELAKIWGVGPQAAQKLYAAGIRSVADLRKKPELLLPLQQVGLKYYEDFNERMPRDEATAISNIVYNAAYELFGKDTIIIETCGSYRRGKQSCGDVDILLTRKDEKPINGMLEKLIVKLEKDEFLKERLGSTRVSDKGSEMYMGVCKLKDG
jgi:DNA polymerase/3'-5' exonuclease PolX